MGGLGLAFADDMHLLGTALSTAVALHSAQPALAPVGLSISWGPDKTEVAFALADHGAAIREWEGRACRRTLPPSLPAPWTHGLTPLPSARDARSYRALSRASAAAWGCRATASLTPPSCVTHSGGRPRDKTPSYL
eukprot:jgi/Tetstr1/428932/TSEL_018908.t1